MENYKKELWIDSCKRGTANKEECQRRQIREKLNVGKNYNKTNF